MRIACAFRGVAPLTMATVLQMASIANAQSPKRPAVVSFATVDQGRALLTRRDDFVRRLSPFDRSARMKTDGDVSERDFLEFVNASVLPWNPEERARVDAAWADLQPKLGGMSLPLPETVYFVKTTGLEEGGQPYTRGDEIVLPQSTVAANAKVSLQGTIAHELFHILSRNAPDLRERLYSLIGFQPCGEIPFPSALVSQKLTDPDAPKNDHCILLDADSGPVWAIPILFSKAAQYNVAEGGTFFQYAQLKFLAVQRPPNPSSDKATTYDTANPRLLDIDQIHGFYEQVGRNTDYIIHPEEILADNFKFLVLGKSDVPSPQILRKLAAALGR